MGVLNPWLKEKLEKIGSPKVLSLIIEFPQGAEQETIRQLQEIPGVSTGNIAFNMVNIRAPLEAIPRLEAIPDIVIHYNTPVSVLTTLRIQDDLLGEISLSGVTIPFSPQEIPGRIASLALRGIMSRQFQDPSVIIVPMSEVRKELCLPENSFIEKTKVAVLDTGLSLPHPAFGLGAGLIKLGTTIAPWPVDGLGHGCVAGNTKVVTSFCGLETLEEIWTKMPGPVMFANGGEEKHVSEAILTNAMSGKARVNALYRTRSRESFRIKTFNNCEIRATPWHKFFVAKARRQEINRFGNPDGHRRWYLGFDIAEVEAKDLRVGDVLLQSTFHESAKQWDKAVILSYLNGLITGDGHMENGRLRSGKPRYWVGIWDSDRTFLNRVAEVIRGYGPSVYVSRVGESNGNELGFTSQVLTVAILTHSLSAAAKDRELLRAWTAGFFDAEGCSSRGKWPEVSITQSNLGLLEQLRDMLRIEGIHCNLVSGGSYETLRGRVKSYHLSFPFRSLFKSFIAPYAMHRKLDDIPVVQEEHHIRPTKFVAGQVLTTVTNIGHEYHDAEWFYDLSTEAGNYVANGLVIHNTWVCTAGFGGQARTRFGDHWGVAEARAGRLGSWKVLSDIGFGTSFSVIKGIELAVRWGARVISMSLGGELQGSVDDDPQCRIIQRLKEQVIFVIAAGNDGGKGTWTIGSPGATPAAVTVGAYSPVYCAVSTFSSRGPNGEYYKSRNAVWQRDLAKYREDLFKPDIIAPGGGPAKEGQKVDLILSGVVGWTQPMYVVLPDVWGSMRGTSMACPLAAGVIALAVEHGLISTAADVKKKMARFGGKDINSGYGAISYEKLI